jgi:hypothetical protein
VPSGLFSWGFHTTFLYAFLPFPNAWHTIHIMAIQGIRKLNSIISWDITLCSLLKANWRFGGTRRLHLQGRRSRALLATYFHAGFLLGLFFDPEDGWQYVPLKRWLTFNRLQGVITQKIVLFITTTVRTSNPTQYENCATYKSSVHFIFINITVSNMTSRF